MATADGQGFGLGELPPAATGELRLAQQPASLPKVLSELNAFVDQGIVDDYAIIGGYAFIYHSVPMSTFDLDVVVLFAGEEKAPSKLITHGKLYAHCRDKGYRIEDEYIYIADLAVQFFPTYIGPLYDGAVKEAQRVEISGVPSKVVTIEYLIALLLTAFRAKDQIRVIQLVKNADRVALEELLERFDDEQHLLGTRLKEVLGEA